MWMIFMCWKSLGYIDEQFMRDYLTWLLDLMMEWLLTYLVIGLPFTFLAYDLA